VVLYNQEAATELHTDASMHGVGGILLQHQQDETLRLWDFIIFTDHKPLTFAFRQKHDKCSPRQDQFVITVDKQVRLKSIIILMN
jgi:hypothetical protein